MTFSVDWADVVLPLLRQGLTTPGVNVMSKVPDGVPNFVPLVVCRRTGGSSFAPDFWDQPWINVQCWAAPSAEMDGARAAHNLADNVRRVLWTVWRQQIVTPAGWLTWLRESSAPEEINDPDLPHFGRYQATYEMRVRKARVLAAP
jgi:hypothetical protein